MRYLAGCAVAIASVLGGCAVIGGGPQLSIGRNGMRFGAQGGVGVGGASDDSSSALRLDLGFVAGKGGHGLAGVTLAANTHEGHDGHVGYGGVISAGVGGGMFLAAGGQGGFYALEGCERGDGWNVMVGVRIVGEDRQFLVWPQYQRWNARCGIIFE